MASTGSSYAGRHRERAEAQQKAATRRRRLSGASLSTHLAQQPGSYDGRKIAAVDKSIEALDALPERYATVKTLYLSKNSLRSLAGVEQFRELKALSAADNLLADLDCLHALPAAGIALEAASFEGNPLADLPNYRAHVIHILGPSLNVLDNRPVTAEERAAAASAVAHEQTMLALMLSNACLVHKLGRAVQLVRLHCELQCAVLGGQYGSSAGGRARGAAAVADVLCSSRGASRMLQMWDYESSLGRQERHAIGLAIRREVGRRYRKLVASGAKPEGSTKLWQQAFAHVMLLQQETIASLLGLLEEAKSEAASSLAPLTRPPSPAKRAALESEAEAQGRLQQDREALIQELRDAFLGLAEAFAHADAPQQAAQFEARIRELHTALEAAGDKLPPGQAAAGSGAADQWSISAVRPAGAAAGPAAAAHTLGSPQARLRPASAVLRSALKQPRPGSSGGWSPARPGGRLPAEQGHCPPSRRPTEVAVPGAGSCGPANNLPANSQPRHRQAPSYGPQLTQRWQADDGLAEYEGMEQARCKTPRPFQTEAQQQPAPGEPPAPSAALQEPCTWEHGAHTIQPRGAPQAGEGPPVAATPGPLPSLPPPRYGLPRPPTAGPLPASAPASSGPVRSRPGSPARARPGSPSQWTPNPLAGGTGPSSPAACSPSGTSETPWRQGLQGVFKLLEREGRVNQVEALRQAVAQYETTAAELQAGNHELAGALEEVQQRVAGLKEQLAAQRQGAEERVAAAEARQAEAEATARGLLQQLEELGGKLQEVLAARQALQAQLDAAAAEQQRALQAAAAERAAAAAEEEQWRADASAREAQLRARVAELECLKSVHLKLKVGSHEAEWRAEAARAAVLEAHAKELSVRLAAHQQQRRLEDACAQLAARAVLRRALHRWRQGAAESARLSQLEDKAVALHRRTFLASWLARWRLAAQRSTLLAAREEQRQRRRLAAGWQAWHAFCQDRVLHRGLEAAAELHREGALLRQCFGGWRDAVAGWRQVDLPAEHPTMRAAVQLQRRRLLASLFCAWRRYMADTVLPRQAAVQLRVLEHFMGSQRRAFAAWQHYLQQRRQSRLLKDVAHEHRLRRLVLHWREAVQECNQRRAAIMQAAFTSDQALLRNSLQAWRQAVLEKRQQVQGKALADQHCRRRALTRCWEGWQEWTALCRGVRQRQEARRQASAFQSWRLAAKAAEKRRLAEACDHRRGLRRFRASLAAWRQVVAAKQAQRGRLAHARALLHRSLLRRTIAGWRRATLAGKLYQALEVVGSLQGAVARAREELECKAEQIDSLNSVRVTVEGTSESLSLRVCNLDADLAAAQRQADELQAAAHTAQLEHEAALQALEQALAMQAAAEAESVAAAGERDAAVAAREDVEARRAVAFSACEAAQQQVAEAEARAASADSALAELVREREMLAAKLAAAQMERAALAAELERVQQEREGLAARLEQAQAETQQAVARANSLDSEQERLRRQRKAAEQAVVMAVAEQQAALKQAGRLTQLCEEQQQQCERLQQQVEQLQGSLAGHAALQAKVAELSQRNKQLQTDSQSQQSQLAQFAAAVERAERDSASLQQAADAAEGGRRRLEERCLASEAEARRLGRQVEALRAAQVALEAQLQDAQGQVARAVARQQELSTAVEALTGQRDELAAQATEAGEERARLAAAWSEERAELQGTVETLQGQLLASNDVLESCRCMLGETCFARSAADQQAASLTELLRSVKAELLLKDASIKSLTRENAQRAQRLRALEAQVAALSRGSSLAEPSLGPGSPQRQLYAGGKPSLTPGVTPGISTAGALSNGSGGWLTGDWRIGTTPAVSARPGSPAGAALPLQGLGFGSTAVQPAPGTSASSGAASHHQQASSASPACSVAPSFMSVPASQQPWQRSASPASPAGGSSKASAPAGSSGSAPASPSAGPPLAELLAPPWGAGSALPPGVGDQQLSYLLELVVNKRVSSAQAQQVINAAVQGDARPLLQTLTAVQRQAPGGAALPAAAEHQRAEHAWPVHPGKVAPMSPSTESELAAVRLQIQQLPHIGRNMA